MEEWRDIAGYEGLYKISNMGNVLSFHKKKTGKLLSIRNSKGWYLSFLATNSQNQHKTLRIHTEVAKAFIGEIPKGYHVHHKDGNKHNNWYLRTKHTSSSKQRSI